MCFVADPMKRATFSDIVEQLEKELNDEEQLEYHHQSEQYASMSSLISNPDTQFKRCSTFSRQLAGSSSDIKDPGDKEMSEVGRASYTKMTHIDNLKNSHLNPSENDNGAKNNITSTTQKINDVINKDGCDYVSNDNTQSEIFDYQNIDSDNPGATNVSLLQPNPPEIQTLSQGYITIQVANES